MSVRLDDMTAQAERMLAHEIDGTPTGRVVYDGQSYSPATRVLPYAATVWEHGTTEEWEEYEAAMDAVCEAHDATWQDGLLIAG